MILDTSAMVPILYREPEAADLHGSSTMPSFAESVLRITSSYQW